MAEIWQVLKTALRATAWKATPGPAAIGLLAVIAWAIVAMVVQLLNQYVAAARPVHFAPASLNALIAWTAIFLAATALFLRPEARAAGLAGLLAWITVFGLTTAAINVVPLMTGWDLPRLALWTSDDARTLIFVASQIWWFGAMLAILRGVQAERRLLRTARVLGLVLAVAALSFVFPYYPAFRGSDFKLHNANLWEYVSWLRRGGEESAPTRPLVDTDRLELTQPALIDAAAARLAPQVKGKTNIYAIGIAGWSEQDVFIKELDGGLDRIAKYLPVDGGVMRLVNHADTVEATPTATRQNFAAAVHAAARIMDPNEDVLVLFMTSHGSQSGVALRMQYDYANLAPEDVTLVLGREGIKNRIVIVSACYSGVFIKPLADDNTIVLTAADENSTSFGCSNEREWTYFGDAFFNHALQPGTSIVAAFNAAKGMIAQWEARDGLSPSNPQGHFGPALLDRLDRMRMRNVVKASVPTR
jgi:Peptidase C13 family